MEFRTRKQLPIVTIRSSTTTSLKDNVKADLIDTNRHPRVYKTLYSYGQTLWRLKGSQRLGSVEPAGRQTGSLQSMNKSAGSRGGEPIICRFNCSRDIDIKSPISLCPQRIVSENYCLPDINQQAAVSHCQALLSLTVI